MKFFLSLLFILFARLTIGQTVIQTNFFGSGSPPNAIAKSSCKYIDVANRTRWRQVTLPQGSTWQQEATNILVDFGYIGGVLPIIQGGTGATTATTAINNLLPSQIGHAGQFLQTNGTTILWASTGGSVTAVDTIYRTLGKDSIQYTISGRYHAILDSAGSGGGSQTLAQTLGFGNTTTGHNIVVSDNDYLQSATTGSMQIDFGNDTYLWMNTDAGNNVTPSLMLNPLGTAVLTGGIGSNIQLTAPSISIVNANKISLDAPAVDATSLTGIGTRMVTASATGVLGVSAIPTGTVTSVATGVWLSGGTITGAGTIIADSATIASYLLRRSDSTLYATQFDILGFGTGTVTSVAVSGSNGIGVSGSPITASGTIALSLGAITPTSVNGITFSGSGSIANTGVTALTGFTGSGTSSGTNTGDQTIGSLSPLTTKGDLFTFSTVNTRLAVGATDGMILGVSSAAATGLVWSTPTYPMARGSSGVILRSDGTNNVYTTATYPTTTTANRILYSSATNTIGEITSANSSVLVTDGSGVPSLSTTLPNIAIGTPTSGTLTNCTGLPTAGLVNSAVTQAKTANYNKYTIWSNNTSAAAAPADDSLHHPGSQSLASGAIHWTGGLAPSTFSSATYNWTLIGNMVTVYMQGIYSVLGTTCTQVLVDWQADMPAPFIPGGLNAASAALYPARGFVSNGITGTVTNGQGMLRRDSGNTVYEVYMAFGSSTVKDFWITFTYYIN